jgi:hypothetical protein
MFGPMTHGLGFSRFSPPLGNEKAILQLFVEPRNTVEERQHRPGLEQQLQVHRILIESGGPLLFS